MVVKLHPEWAPIGVTRIKQLTADSFWDECRAFRVLPNFVVQLGINGNPELQRKWKKPIADDPVNASNTRGTVTFAMAGPGTRTTQIFFNKIDNSRLDTEKFAPFGEVIRCVNHSFFWHYQLPRWIYMMIMHASLLSFIKVEWM